MVNGKKFISKLLKNKKEKLDKIKNFKKMYFIAIIYLLILILLLIFVKHNLSSSGIIFIYKSNINFTIDAYFETLNKTFIFIVTILYLAISFKTVSIWKMSFISYLNYKNKYLIPIDIGTIIISLILNFLRINNVIIFNEYIRLYFLMILLYIFIISIGILLKELYYSGDNKIMNEEVEKIFLKHNNTLFSTIDYNHSLKDKEYYSFLKKMTLENLQKIHLYFSKNHKNITNFEYVLFLELINRQEREEKNVVKTLEKNDEFIDYLYKSKDFDVEILLECSNTILNGEAYQKVIIMFKKLIDDGKVLIADLFHPTIQGIYSKNETLIDELIIYSMEKPSQNSEEFIYILLENSTKYSATSIENDVINIGNDSSAISRNKSVSIRTNDLEAIYFHGTNISKLNFSNYYRFIDKVKSCSGLELLHLLQDTHWDYYLHEGFYGIKYKLILYEFLKVGRNIDLILKNSPIDFNIIDTSRTFLTYDLNFQNIKYLELKGELKNKIFDISKDFDKNIRKILEKENKYEISEAKNTLRTQINNSREISIDIFLKLYTYLVEDVNRMASNLSEEFYISFRRLVTNVDFKICESLLPYLVNINFILYDKSIREYDNFNRMHMNIPANKNILIYNVDFHIAYQEAFILNYGINLLQYYIDFGKLPEVRFLSRDDSLSIEVIKRCCDLIKELYKEKTLHSMPGYTGFKTIKVKSNGLSKTRKVSSIISSNHELKYEKRTVFLILLKLLNGIETDYVLTNDIVYKEKIEDLLIKLGIEYKKE